MKHTKEPWQVDAFAEGDEGETLIDDVAQTEFIGSIIIPEDALRIVDCVNALEGLNPLHIPSVLNILERLVDEAEPFLKEDEASNTWHVACAVLSNVKA